MGMVNVCFMGQGRGGRCDSDTERGNSLGGLQGAMIVGCKVTREVFIASHIMYRPPKSREILMLVCLQKDAVMPQSSSVLIALVVW